MYARVNKLVFSFCFRAIPLMDIRCYVYFFFILSFFYCIFCFLRSFLFFFFVHFMEYPLERLQRNSRDCRFFHLSICFLVLSLVFFNKLPEPCRWWSRKIRLSLNESKSFFPRRIVALEHRVSQKKLCFVSSFHSRFFSFIPFKFTSRKIYIRVCIIYNSHRPMSRTLSRSIGKKTWSWLPEKISVYIFSRQRSKINHWRTQ